MKRKVISKFALCALVVAALVAMFALAACSQPAQSSSGSSASEKPEAPSKEPTVATNTDPFWVLIVGNDTRLGTVNLSGDYADGNARSDTMMIAYVDPKNYKVTAITIPRDTEAEVHGEKMKINMAYQLDGIQGTLDQVELLTGIRPKYYMDMTFVGFEEFIDALGGVDAYVPIDMSYKDIVHGDMIDLSEGEQELNGPEALVLARVRKAYGGDMDAHRQINDRALVWDGIQQVLQGKVSVEDGVKALMDNCDTNFTSEELEGYANLFLQNAAKAQFVSASGPYDGDVDPDIDLWVAWRDEDTWHEMVQTTEAGGDPNDVFSLPFEH